MLTRALPHLCLSFSLGFLAACSGTEPSRVITIVLTPLVDTLVVEDPLQISVKVLDAQGNALPGVQLDWRSSNSLVASVDSHGVVRGISRGTVTISAESHGIMGSSQIVVRDPYFRITIDRRLPSLFPADTTLLTVAAYDSSNQRFDRKVAAWTSRNPLIASVSAGGIVSSHTEGLAMIEARVGGVRDSVEVAVVPKRVRANREIAFVRDTSSSTSLHELWLTMAVDSEAWRISTAGRYLHSFAWSPDGSLLAISYFINQLGQPALFELVALAPGTRRSFPMFAGNPQVSPDNRRVAFTHYTGSDNALATMAVDGSDLHVLNLLPGNELVPSWSPDGRQLAFLFNPSPGVFQLWVVHSDGNVPHRISTGSFARNPVWSPDGKYLAYDDGDRVWIADPETGQVHSLSPPGVVGFPSWSSDGTRILYGVGGAVRLVRLDGTQVSEVAALGLFPEVGSISPDGSRLAVERSGQSGSHIVVTELDGGHPLTVSGYNSWLPAWRP